MNSTLIDLRGKLPEGLVGIYREVDRVVSERQLEALVVGAMARDLVLVHGFNARLERGTRDIDFAVQVRNWEAFKSLSDFLITKGFQKDKNIAHRFYWQTEGRDCWEVDILPCGQVVDEENHINWPPDGSIRMSALGFDEAFSSALSVQMGDEVGSFEMKVASPAAMSILKLNSWLEREPTVRNKDAQDLRYIMKSYCKIPIIKERMYEEGDMAFQDWDEDKASARILGRDAAKLLENKTFKFLCDALFSQPDKLDILLREQFTVSQVIEYEQSLLSVFIETIQATK